MVVMMMWGSSMMVVVMEPHDDADGDVANHDHDLLLVFCVAFCILFVCALLFTVNLCSY